MRTGLWTRRRRVPSSARGRYLRALLLTLALAASPVRARAHAIHSTLTEITIEPNGALTIRIRTFADDFSLGVNRLARTTPRADHVVSDDAAARYVAASFRITPGAIPLALTFVSQRRTGDVVWLELRAPAAPSERLSLLNAMLFDVHSDQVNIVKAIRGSSSTTMLFSNGDRAKALRIS